MAESNVRLRVDARDAVSQLNRVNRAANKTEKEVNGLTGSLTKLVGAFAGIKTAQFVFFKTAELETQARSLQVLTGSLKETKSIIQELQRFGNVTPFTSSELIDTARRLKAFGVQTEKLVDITKRLGDVAGATGADLGGIATAFGQIQAKGRLQGEELLQLQERGVDLQGTLRREYDLTAEEFQKALSAGRIGADAVNFALVKLTEAGGQYADGAIAQSDTLNGKFSTLQDNIDTLARTIGQTLSPVIKAIFDQANQAISAINRLLAAGRQGGFNRSVAGIGTALTFGATGQAVDTAQKLLGQVTPQNNREGIEQNLRVLRQVSDQLRRIGANDPNASRAVSLQGVILNLRSKNLAALDRLPAEQMSAVVAPPSLGMGTASTGGGGSSRARSSVASGRQDASFEMLQLTRELLAPSRQLSELEKISLGFQIDKQKILEANLLPREREIEMLKAEAQFERDLLNFGEDQAKLRAKEAQDAAELQKRLREAEQARLEADPGFQMKQQFEELIKLENQVAAGATAIGGSFSQAFKGIVTGTKSANQALGDMMSSIAEHFADMAGQIIAQQLAMILYGTIMRALGVTLPGAVGGGGGGFGQFARGVPGVNTSFNLPVRPFAEGGFVTGPTNALIGEGGEPEYVIPESKMRASMERFSRGARGSSVISNDDEMGDEGDGFKTGMTQLDPIDVRYNIERINNVDYVTNDQFQEGLSQAAAQGAQRGEMNTLKRLQMSQSSRRRIGI